MRIGKEGKRKLKASLANTALFLSVFVVLFPLALPTVSASGTWRYVGGSGGGNYTVIQDAIDDSSDGDTVFVYDDSSPYLENLLVDVSIDLIGENRETTVIDGDHLGTVITISASWVNVTGFT